LTSPYTTASAGRISAKRRSRATMMRPSGRHVTLTRRRVEVRPGQVEVAEEDRRQRVVVVLAGVDQALVDAARRECPDDRRGLHEVGPGADDVCYGSSHVPSVRGAGVGLPAEPIPLSMGPG
jgi:hypothetical protein